MPWYPAKNDARGDSPPQLYPFQSHVCSRELQKCYYVVLSGCVGCILRAGIKFCHRCPWAICHCVASSSQSRLLLLPAWHETWNSTPSLGRKKIIPCPLLLALLSWKSEKCIPPCPLLMMLPRVVLLCLLLLHPTKCWDGFGCSHWRIPADGRLCLPRDPHLCTNLAVTVTSGDRKLPSRLQRAEQEVKPLKLYLFFIILGIRQKSDRGRLAGKKFLKKRDIYHQGLFLPSLFSRHGQNFNSLRCFELKQTQFFSFSHCTPFLPQPQSRSQKCSQLPLKLVLFLLDRQKNRTWVHTVLKRYHYMFALFSFSIFL